MIHANEISKKFIRLEKKKKVEFYALSGVGLTAHDGETLGILGPNGAGKTTLLRILGRLMDPTEGTVRHILPDGTELFEKRLVKRHMGYLSDNTKLYRRFSPRELLYFLSDIYELPADVREDRVQAMISMLEMDQFADSRIAKLSTGQTQRVSIARCLLHNPDTYIFDEPTLGLDIMSAAAIVEFMHREKEAGKTIVYSTHYMEEAERLCDRVILINRGRIVGEGTPRELRDQTGTASLRDAFLTVIREDGGEVCA